MAGKSSGRVNVMPFAQPKRKYFVYYLLEVISSVLEELVRAGEQERALGNFRYNRQVSKFNGLHPTPITIAYYLQRIAQFSGCSNECFVLMLIYIDRLVTRKNVALDAYNVHRLIISAILLSAKFFDDHFFFNPHFALVGGLKEREMNTLELEFLFLIEFDLYVTAEDYQTYYNTLAQMAHTRFMNKIMPPLPNVPHDEKHLPQPLDPPEKRLPLANDDVVVVPLPKHCQRKLKEEKMENDKSHDARSQYSQDSFGQSQVPQGTTNCQLDHQWVHVSTSDASSKMNHVHSSFNDFTIVNKSPEEYDMQRIQRTENMNAAVYPYAWTNNHPVAPIVHHGTYSDPALINNGYVGAYPNSIVPPQPHNMACEGYDVQLSKQTNHGDREDMDRRARKAPGFRQANSKNAR